MTDTQTQGTAKQSRVGKHPVPVPKGVTVSIRGQDVTVTGPKGSLSRALRPEVSVRQDGDRLVIAMAGDDSRAGAQYQGLTRALLSNMVRGVQEGYKLSLDFYGVGYRAEVKDTDLLMSLGLSHGVRFELPAVVKARVETIDEAGTKRPRVHLESHDKEVLGQVASRIRSFRPPEPYKGKGVRYTGEKIRTKAGKAGGKAGGKGK